MNNIHPEILEFWKTEEDKKASDADLDDLESIINIKLPDSYRDYQKEIGYKRIRCKNSKYKWGDVYAGISVKYNLNIQVIEKINIFNCFYSIKSVISNQKIFSEPMPYNPEIGPRIPLETLTIGAAMGHTSGQVLMNISEKNFGTIWYWDRVDETWGTNGNDMLGFLGVDVYDVLGKLFPYE